MKRNNKGFTLAELLIVVAVIAVLVAVAIPTFSNQLEKSRQAVDVSNLRGAYAAAKLATMDGKIDGVEIDAAKAYYYDPDTGNLSEATATDKVYGKSAGAKVVADISNLSGEIVFDASHLPTNDDRRILVSFNVFNKVPSIKMISFEPKSATTNSLPNWSATGSGTVKSIDALYEITQPTSNTGSNTYSLVSLTPPPKFIVTTDKGRYALAPGLFQSALGNDGWALTVDGQTKTASTSTAITTAGTAASSYTVTIAGVESKGKTGSVTFTVNVPAKVG